MDRVCQHYAGRGIRVCERWDDFNAFLADMGPAPTLGHSLDRIDPNGNYEPSNVRWALHGEQQRNRRNTPRITIHGKSMALSDAVELYGAGAQYHSVVGRIKRGWDPVTAVTTPLHPSGRRRK